MNTFGAALGYGLLASSALVLGALAGALWRPPKRLTGTLLAFASGTLIAAVALELLPQARALSGLWRAALGLLAGAATFVLLNTWIDRKAAPVASRGAQAGAKESRPEVLGEASRGLGLALLASVTLDGLPENLALGASLHTGASLALLIAISASKPAGGHGRRRRHARERQRHRRHRPALARRSPSRAAPCWPRSPTR